MKINKIIENIIKEAKEIENNPNMSPIEVATKSLIIQNNAIKLKDIINHKEQNNDESR